MKKVYIQSVGSVSAQKTFDNTEFLNEIIEYNDTVMYAVDPVYKDYIPPAAARRMAKGIKMSVVASKIALSEAGLQNVDAIITGTGMGCLKDSEKFLSAIIDNNEAYLTPTSFIQSTHNTVGGQIALGLGCKGYNFTYVHSSVSFESALIDAKMQLELEEASTIIVGGTDELADHTIKLHKIVNHIKVKEVSTNSLLTSGTIGTVCGEGANFFVLANKKNEASYAEVVAVDIVNTIQKSNLEKVLLDFLNQNAISAEDVDLLVLGNNGDVLFDDYYHLLQKGLFSEIQQLYYKHLCGEYNTSSSFGLWMASKILKTETVPAIVKLNERKASKLEVILLYNQYRGGNHSFTLIRKC